MGCATFQSPSSWNLLGGFGDNFAKQKIAYGYRIFATAAYWNSHVYLAGVKGPLTDYVLNPAAPALSLAAATTYTYGFPGSSPSVSASGSQDGIVWSLDTSQYCTANSPGCGPAVLHANDAGNVATQLWSSADAAGDAAGNAVKFAVPTIANGKVYVGTRGNNTGGLPGSTSVTGELDVYGLPPMVQPTVPARTGARAVGRRAAARTSSRRPFPNLARTVPY